MPPTTAIEDKPADAAPDPVQASGLMSKSFDVFISYSHKDKDWVDVKLLAPLEKAGLQVCIDSRDFDIGRASRDNMEYAATHSRHTIAVLTPDWLLSDWTAFEVLLVQTDDPAGRKRRLLPLMLKQVELPPGIRFLTYADFVDSARYEDEMKRLLTSLSVKADIQDVLPRNDEFATGFARNGLIALAELVKSPDVLPHVAVYRMVFEQAQEHIDKLKKYKALHDCLHILQVQCYYPLLSELTRFPQSEESKDAISDNEQTLEGIITRSKGIVDHVDYLDNDSKWIASVEQGWQELKQARTDGNAGHLKTAERYLRRVLGTQPSRINNRLNEAAQSVPLAELVKAMGDVLQKISKLHLDQTRLDQFGLGVEALGGLHIALTRTIRDHDGWQILDTDLRMIESDTDQLQLSLPDLEKQAERLCERSVEVWVGRFRESALQLRTAAAGGDPADMLRNFRRFRRQALDRFYQVDLTLMKLCGDLGEVAHPLATILEVIL
jgi:hypothetical protein